MRIDNNIDLLCDDLLELFVKERKFRVIGKDGDVIAQEMEDEDNTDDNDDSDSLNNPSYDTSTDEDGY